jgi:hypothetical protein
MPPTEKTAAVELRRHGRRKRPPLRPTPGGEAVSIGGVHSTAAVALGLPRVESVSGRRIFVAARTNLL